MDISQPIHPRMDIAILRFHRIGLGLVNHVSWTAPISIV